MKQKIYVWNLRLFTAFFLVLIRLAEMIVPKQKNPKQKALKILVTGTFYSDQWLMTHLVPLAEAANVSEITMVADREVPRMSKVKPVYPAAWLERLIGGVAARSVTFLYKGVFQQYDIVAGFHLLLNGMMAALIAKMRRKRSLYFCGGGPREVLGGGFETQNKIYGRLNTADPMIERMLLAIVSQIDIVVCMGSSGADFFQLHNVKSQIEIVPGGFDSGSYYPAKVPPVFDFILVGRLSPVKQVDLFLHCLAALKKNRSDVSAVIVGDGPSRGELESLIDRLHLESNVTLVGWQSDVGIWMRKARIFVLTSESEGLSQALIQGLLCGLPAVVSDVGDLGDVVVEGQNGYLVKDISVAGFCRVFEELLEDAVQLGLLSRTASASAQKYRTSAVAQRWPTILQSDSAASGGHS